MADSKTQIVITAEDKTAAAFATAKAGLERFSAAYAALGGLAGVGVAAALVAGVKSVIDFGDEMNDLSQKVGISVKDLATWKLAAEQSGTSLDSVARGVKGLSQYMVQNGAALREAGITATDANGALVQLADLFAAMPDGVEKTALAVQLFGKAGMDMIPMLNLGSKGMGEAQKKAESYAKELAKLAPEADKFNDAMRELKLQGEATWLTIGTKLAPGMEGLALWIKDARSGTEGLADALEYLSEKAGNSELLKGLSWLVRESGTERSIGYSGQKTKLGLPMSEGERFDAAAEAYMADAPARAAAAEARKRAKKLAKESSTGSENVAKSVGSVNDYATRVNEAVAGAINSSAVVKSRELASQIEALDKLFFDSGLDMDIYTSAMAKLTGQTDKASKEAGRLMQLLEATPTAKLEETRKDMELLTGALEAGHITEEQFIEATQARLGTLGQTVKEVDNFARDMGLSFASAFEDAVIGGKDAIDVVRALGQDIERIILRKTITEPLGNSISSTIKDSGIFGDLFGGDSPLQLSGPKSANGNVFDPSGLVAFANGGIVSRPTLFPFAKGVGLMGEAGAEAILPLQRGPNGKLGVQAGGGGVTVNIIEDSSRAGQTQSRQEQGGASVLDVFVDRIRAAVAGDITRGNGPIPAAMASTYGLNRAAGGY